MVRVRWTEVATELYMLRAYFKNYKNANCDGCHMVEIIKTRCRNCTEVATEYMLRAYSKNANCNGCPISEQYTLFIKLNHLNKGSYYYQSNHCTPASRSSFSLSWCKLVTTWTYLDLLRRLFQSTTICPLVAEPDNSTVHGQIVEALMTCLSRATAMATGSHAIQSCTL